VSAYPRVATLLASAARTTAVANSGGTGVDCARARRISCLLDVTATAGVAGDTLDVFVDVLAPDGVTWMNAGHFAQIAGNSAAVKHFLVLDSASVAATSFAVSSDCAAGVTKPYLFGTQIRARHTLVDAGAHGQSVTFSVSAFLQ
jgi:hypothetical protein